MEISKARYQYNVPKKRKNTVKRVMLVLAVCLLFAASLTYVFAAFSKPLAALTPEPVAFASASNQPVALTWPSGGQSAIGSVEQGVLASSSSTETPAPIASMTKIMTALAVLDKSPLAVGEAGPTYTFDTQDVALYRDYLARQGSVVPVTVGQTMSQYQMLEYLLVISANNLADSLVREHFGSMEAYTAQAMEMAEEYGLEHTAITDASGFSPATVSTPSDLIKLGARALANPVIASIVSKATVNLPGYGQVTNSNQLLKQDGVVGIKTGTTDEAGNCLLFAAKHRISEGHEVTIIGVVMGMRGTTNLYNAARTLLDESKRGFAEITVIDIGVEVGNYTTPWGQQSPIVTTEALKTYGWLDRVPAHDVQMKDASVALPAGQEVGRIVLDTTEQSSVPLASKNAVSTPTAFWRLSNLF